MIVKQTKIRVRYSESDQMKFTHHSNYVAFFEIGRIEFLRDLGINYSKLEQLGIGLPVLNIDVKYIKPTFFDDEILIETRLENKPSGAKILFSYKIYNLNNILLTKGSTELAFMNLNTGKPIRCPENLNKIFSPYFDI
ncbi:MAG: acyl-CoA thioesterase [Solirubrobacteraceae bacterium]